MSPRIKYVCLSDTHFGDPHSLLTNIGKKGDARPMEPSPVLDQLVTCLGTLIPPDGEPPTLILNGDILELALTTTNDALMSFMQFVRLLVPPPEAGKRRLCKRIIYLNGNHDHHIWETARETQYRNYLEAKKDQLFSNLAHKLPTPYHATNIFEGGRTISPPSDLLETAVGLWPWLQDNALPISVFYPNFGVFDDRMQRCVVFHHGHFLESLYALMSIGRRMAFREKEWLLGDTQVWDIEAENFAWIDFLWSTLGRSGAVGKAVDVIYHILPDEHARKKLIDNLASELPKHVDIPWVPTTWAERRVLNSVLNKIVDSFSHTGRGEADRGNAVDEMIAAYVNGPLQMQMKGELRSSEQIQGNDLPFDDLTFVYGHTHKPAWHNNVDVARDHKLHQIFNTGGWVVESPDTGSGHGATMVVLDEQLKPAAVRVFQDLGEDSDYRAEVQGEGPLADHLRERLFRSPAAWNMLGQLTMTNAAVRRTHIKNMLLPWCQGNQ